MNLLVKKIGLLLLLSVSAVAVLANPGQPRAPQDGGRAEQQQELSGGNDSHAARGFQYPDTSASRGSDDGFKKQSRLSPEARRALRRQINQAGQDLYLRKP